MHRTRSTVAALGLIASMLVGTSSHADDIRDRQWHLTFLDLAEVHGLSRGNGVVVALIDTGVQANHPDLSGNVRPGTATVSDAASRDGRVDRDGHGTGMAGIIVGHGHNGGDGVLGLAPRASILPIQALGRGDEVTDGPGGLPAAVDFAIAHRVTVMSISIAASNSPELEASIDRALAADIVVVAGAGNTNVGLLQVAAPARYPGVVAVAAVDRNGNHASISMTGPEVVLAAPGVDIVSTNNDGGYRIGTGTSDATAIVSGAVALIRAKYPQLSAKEVVHRLTATATDKGPPGRDDEYGYGVLNLVDALTKDVPPLTGGTSTASATTTPDRGHPSDENRGIARVALIAGGALLVLVLMGALVLRRRARR